MKNVSRYLFLSLCSILLVGSVFADEASDRSMAFCASLEKSKARLNRATLANEDKMYADISSKGVAPVIVTLRQPDIFKTMTGEQWKSKSALSVLHQETAATADVVLERVGKRVSKVHVLENVAGFTCNVTSEGLSMLLTDKDVMTIAYSNVVKAQTRQGVALMNAMGATRSPGTYTGQGVSIAIVDTGVDYTHPQLGGGGFPNSKVIGGHNFGDPSFPNDPHPKVAGGAGHNHGTCCAGTAAGSIPPSASAAAAGDYVGGVVPDAKIYALKITQGSTGSANDDAIVAAWDWCVTHRNDDAANPLLVISTSFGGGQYQDSTSTDQTFGGVVTAATNAGITILASSGNDGFCNAVASPSAATNVISVGAVYDAAIGTLGFGFDSTTCLPLDSQSQYWETAAADKVTCYSNSHANLLDVFAPSHNNATTDLDGGYDATFGGTSSACPYAAGAVAALQCASKAIVGAYQTPAQIEAILKSSGQSITDSKASPTVTKSRVDVANAISQLSAGAAPPNDNFANAYTITVDETTYDVSNLNATTETGEPAHGSASIWWKVTASKVSPLTFSVDGGSGMVPQITVYTGSAVNALTQVVQGDSSVSLTPTVGTTYYVAVALKSGTTGDLKLTFETVSIKATLLSPENGVSYGKENVVLTFQWDFTQGVFAPGDIVRFFISDNDEFNGYVYYEIDNQTKQISIDNSDLTDFRESNSVPDNQPLYWTVGNASYKFAEPFTINLISVPSPPTDVDSILVWDNNSWVAAPQTWPPSKGDMQVKLTVASGKHVVKVSYDDTVYTLDDRIATDTDGSRVLGATSPANVSAAEATAPAGYVRFALPATASKAFTITSVEVPVALSGLELE